MVNLLYGQRLEKVATRQKQEGNTSQCPHIYFLRVAFLFLDELGSHEERRAEHKAHAMHWVELRCESKVNNLDVEVVLVVGLKEDVLKFEVTMRNIFGMKILERIHQLTYDDESLPFTESIRHRFESV